MNFPSNPKLRSLFPAKIAAVALSAIAMRADAEDRFARIAASWTKQDLRHVLDDKPPLRFGDDAEDSLANWRSTKKPRFSDARRHQNQQQQQNQESRPQTWCELPKGVMSGRREP